VPCSRSRMRAAPGQNDGEHGDVVDDFHDGGEPGLREDWD
jgi:hypothetical protein